MRNRCPALWTNKTLLSFLDSCLLEPFSSDMCVLASFSVQVCSQTQILLLFCSVMCLSLSPSGRGLTVESGRGISSDLSRVQVHWFPAKHRLINQSSEQREATSALPLSPSQKHLAVLGRTLQAKPQTTELTLILITPYSLIQILNFLLKVTTKGEATFSSRVPILPCRSQTYF